MIRAASDVGGTFTDLVWYEVDSTTGLCGEVRSAKTDTTPPRFEEGVMNALTEAGLPLSELAFFAHGSTVIINAITERKGARTALITTAGFRDVLEIARGNRPDLFNFRFRKPPALVERHLRAELPERMDYKGEVLTPVDLNFLPSVLEHFRAEGVEAIAVCFLYAYLNPENERRTTERIAELWPEVSVLASHQISREWREYERTSTTVLSAYVHPVARRYIETLETQLAEGGYRGTLFMMQSNCGISTASAARQNPISMVESGPASGIYAAAHLGRTLGLDNLIVLDIGGTTAKCTLVEAGTVKVSTQYWLEKTPTHPGYPVQTPVSEIVEIGNGGGSIAWIDEGGKFHVGPQSAGASPGPAAYGRGGQHATTTDANLVLGRIDPNGFVGGAVQPDWDAVHAAFAPLSERLGTTLEETARGVVRIANANMTNALRLISVNKGFDPRDFVLVAFGGGGAMHAVALAEELRIPKVVVPANSAVFSAWGMLLTDLRRDYVRTHPMNLAGQTCEAVDSVFVALEAEARQDFAADGINLGSGDITFEHLLDMRYSGQEHTVKVALARNPDGAAKLASTIETFHTAHEKQFTYRLEAAVQIVNFHLVAVIPVDKPKPARRAVTGLVTAEIVTGTRRVDFDRHGIHDALIYDGLRCEPGMEMTGPAIVQEPSVTLVVQPGHTVSLDEYGNYHVTLNLTKDSDG